MSFQLNSHCNNSCIQGISCKEGKLWLPLNQLCEKKKKLKERPSITIQIINNDLSWATAAVAASEMESHLPIAHLNTPQLSALSWMCVCICWPIQIGTKRTLSLQKIPHNIKQNKLPMALEWPVCLSLVTETIFAVKHQNMYKNTCHIRYLAVNALAILWPKLHMNIFQLLVNLAKAHTGNLVLYIFPNKNDRQTE